MGTPCTFCQAETELYNSGVPVCLKCAQEREAKSRLRHQVLNILHEDLRAATQQAKAATAAFEAVTGEVSSALPPPDGAQRIRNVSRELSLARAGLMIAHNRLNDYLARGIVPEDLKQGS